MKHLTSTAPDCPWTIYNGSVQSFGGGISFLRLAMFVFTVWGSEVVKASGRATKRLNSTSISRAQRRARRALVCVACAMSC